MINNLISDNFKRSFAEFISIIAYAPIISIPAFAVINYFLLNLYDFLIINTVCAIFAGILPSLLVLSLLKKRSSGKKIDMDIPERTDRHYPLILVIITYIIGTIVLYALNAPAITTVLMFCYFSNTLILFLINLYWKISIHAMGVAGPSVALIYVFGPLGLVFSPIIPLVMWSRLYLKKHTFFQVIIGALLGLSLTALQIYYLI